MLLPFFLASFSNDPDAEADESASASDPSAPAFPADRWSEEHIPDDHPAYDRVQTRPEPVAVERPKRPLWQRLLIGIVGIGIGLLFTLYVLRPGDSPDGPPDLLTLAAAQAESITLTERTDDLDVAQEYIYQEFGWPVRVPVLPDARLVGVGVAELANDVEVPVLQYRPEDGALITVYLYDYAFLDDAQRFVRLADPVYARLAEDDPVDVRRVGPSYLVLWRRRAAIYTAVLTDDPGPLVEYLRRR